ncbi:MAG TPA: hypothetical protein VG844_19640 [Terracidiphilus sp.]|nr:hypothetical protein [Terracidiphilus sp.]
MIHNLMYWGIYVFQILFFIGLAGCVIVVAMCWVIISRDSLSKDSAPGSEEQQQSSVST